MGNEEKKQRSGGGEVKKGEEQEGAGSGQVGGSALGDRELVRAGGEAGEGGREVQEEGGAGLVEACERWARRSRVDGVVGEEPEGEEAGRRGRRRLGSERERGRAVQSVRRSRLPGPGEGLPLLATSGAGCRTAAELTEG